LFYRCWHAGEGRRLSGGEAPLPPGNLGDAIGDDRMTALLVEPWFGEAAFRRAKRRRTNSAVGD
jgi:hypothetical protein